LLHTSSLVGAALCRVVRARRALSQSDSHHAIGEGPDAIRETASPEHSAGCAVA
jgi:hypothetical protein